MDLRKQSVRVCACTLPPLSPSPIISACPSLVHFPVPCPHLWQRLVTVPLLNHHCPLIWCLSVLITPLLCLSNDSMLNLVSPVPSLFLFLSLSFSVLLFLTLPLILLLSKKVNLSPSSSLRDCDRLRNPIRLIKWWQYNYSDGTGTINLLLPE